MNVRSNGVAHGVRSERGSRCVVAAAAVVAAGLIAARSAWGVGECDPATLCPGAGACTVNGLHTLTEGCSLDFSGRAVTVNGTLQAEKSHGSFKLTAASLTLQGGALKARGDAAFGGGTITLAVTGPMTMLGNGARIDVSATSGSAKSGGTVGITAGSIDIAAGTVDAGGATGADCGDGGDVVFEAGDGAIRIAGVVAATSDEDCNAGSIAISGGSVAIEKTLDAGGGDASFANVSVDVTATTGDLTVASGGRVEASGTRGGSGGSIALTTERGAIQIAGAVSATGATPDGSGGSVTLAAANAVNVLGGTIDVEGKGVDSDGGSIEVSGLDIDVAAGAVLNADGGSTNAGSISLAGLTGDNVSGTLLAKGSNGGDGGTIALEFCSVTITGTMDVSTAGGGCAGGTDVTARTIHITASARLLASPCCDPPCHGLTVTTGSPTIDPGAMIDPEPPGITVDPSLSLCCGNGTVDHADEQCDDGNRLYCDGCRPNCTQEPQGTVCPEDGNLCTNNVCDSFMGCIAPQVSCPSDGITCTADCNPALGCAPTPDDLRCNDGVPCTLNVCDPPNGDPVTGCRFPDAPDGSSCDDGDVCTRGETCAGGTCAGGPLCCDDANPCTADSCILNFGCVNSEQSGLCSPCTGQPAGSSCTDGDSATIGDACDGNGNCVSGPSPSCDDGDPCTFDLPSGSGCIYLDVACHAGCAGQPDATPCGDSDACTTGECQAGVCVSTPRDCDDGNPANGEEICVGVQGCRSIPPGAQCAVPCGNGRLDPGEECDDGNNASGDCCSASCELEPAQSACSDEGNPCTDDVCDGAGTCVHLDNAAPCDDGDPCTLSSTCSAGACVGDPACDDGDACTLDDTCVGGTCVGDPTTCGDGIVQASCGEDCDDGNTASGDGCSSTCQTEFLCLPVPQVGCRRPIEPARSKLLLKNMAPDSNDKLVWNWTKGATTTKAEFGRPLAITDYLLCLYDAGTLVSSALVPADQVCAGKPCWKETTRGFTYGDKDATPDGITKLQLREGLVPGTAKILVKGKGANLAMPTLPMTEPVLVQLRNSSSDVCWEAAFSPPPQKNDAEQYKDKSD